MAEINFNDILGGGPTAPPPPPPPTSNNKPTQSAARIRQQSCSISEVDAHLLPSNVVNQPGPAFRASLVDMLNLDRADESLVEYKKSLLGEINEEQLKQDEPTEIEIIKVEVVCADRPGGNIVLDFMKGNDFAFRIKEGSVYRLRVHFYVRNDLVYGFTYVNNVFKAFAKVDKESEPIGCYAPSKKPYVFDLPLIEAPSGFIARGDYKGKGLFIDKDSTVHCQFNYVLTIASDW